MKKATVLLLAAAIALSSAGCGKEKKQGSADKNTLSYWAIMPKGIVSVCKSFNDVPMYQELEKKTGIHIEFIHPPTGQENEQFSLMLASKDYPDLIETAWVTYPGGQAKAIKDNVIISLNDLMPKYAPDCYEKIKSNPAFDRLSKTDEGDYYMFPCINDSKFKIFGGLVLRADWLKELNLPVPETIEQWETTLRAFKEKKGASAPLTCQVALVNSSISVNAFNGAFDVGKRFYVDNNKVKYGPMEDSYKDWLSLMNRWYSQGLIDVDYATNTSSEVLSKMANGESGATFGFVGSTLGPLLQMKETEDPSYDLVAAPYIAGADGTSHFAALEADVVDSGSLAVTTACEDPVTAVKWANNLYTKEGMVLRYFGVEGVSYTMENGVPKFVENITNNKDGVSIMEMAQRYSRAMGASPGYSDHETYKNLLDQVYVYDRQKEAFSTWSAATDSAREHQYPYISPSAEDADEFSALNTEISTYVDEMVFKFVNGSKPLSEFDAFRETLKKMGVERYIEINSKSYERFLKR